MNILYNKNYIDIPMVQNKVFTATSNISAFCIEIPLVMTTSSASFSSKDFDSEILEEVKKSKSKLLLGMVTHKKRLLLKKWAEEDFPVPKYARRLSLENGNFSTKKNTSKCLSLIEISDDDDEEASRSI